MWKEIFLIISDHETNKTGLLDTIINGQNDYSPTKRAHIKQHTSMNKIHFLSLFFKTSL